MKNITKIKPILIFLLVLFYFILKLNFSFYLIS